MHAGHLYQGVLTTSQISDLIRTWSILSCTCALVRVHFPVLKIDVGDGSWRITLFANKQCVCVYVCMYVCTLL